MEEKLNKNKIRIKEFDIARAIAIILMIAVHTEFAIYNYDTSWFGTLLDYLGSPFAAPIFMFILGANVFLSSKNSPKQLFTRGITIFGLSIIFNIICHALPFFILDFINGVKEYKENALHWIFAVDILTFSGLAFIFFSIVKKLKINNIILLIIGVIASILNIILTHNFPFDFNSNVIISSITSLFYNSSITGYFSFLSWIIFPIAGYIFIQILVKVKNKNKFYLTVGGISLVIYLICILISYTWLKGLPFIDFTQEYSYYQMHPFNAFGTIVFCLMWISLMYFLSKIIPSVFDKHIGRLNKNLTLIYIIQWFLINYVFVLSTNGNLSVNEWQYILSFIGIIVASDFIAWIITKYKEWKNRI